MSAGLKKNSLGLVHSVAMGIAGSAPTFSISATMVTLIGAVGVLAPASLVYCGLLVLGIVFAYMHLNTHAPNAGASYSWVSEIFGKRLGFFAGWTVLVASALFMVSATIPAGSATLLLVSPALAQSQIAVTLCAIAWLIVVTVVIVQGIKLTGKVQIIMTAIELIILSIVSIAAIIEFGPHALHTITWQQFSPFAFSPTSFANGAIIALFFFWGWDVSLNLTEETTNSKRSPGIGAVAAMIIIIAAFTAFAAVSLVVLSDDEINKSGTNIVFDVANKLFPAPWSYLAVLALMLSTIGNLETSMLQFSRTMFAQSRDGVLNERWSKVHAKWQTPHWATFLIAIIGFGLLISSLVSVSIAEVMKASINIIGVQAAYYYGLAGLACAWHFRRDSKHSVWNFITMLILPVISALALWWAAFITILSFDWVVATIAIGSLLLGLIPLLRKARLATLAEI
ncbi:amino acid transporter [Oxalobacteraceae bacterium GrIS 2.11]